MRPIRYILLLLSFLFTVVACGPTRAIEPSPTASLPTSTPPPTRTALAPTVTASTIEAVLPPTTDRLPPTAVAMLPSGQGGASGQSAPPNDGAVNQADALVRIAIFSPVPGSTLAGTVSIDGAAMHPQFAYYQLEYAPDPNPSNIWYPVSGVVGAPVLSGTLGIWSTGELADGLYQLRLTVGLRSASALTTIVNKLRVQNTASAPIPSPTPVPAVPPPVAAFVATPLSGTAPLTVQFYDQSVGAGSRISWNFGDGSSVRGELNPVHTYTKPGVYTVILTTLNEGGRSTVTRQITVQPAPLPATPLPSPTPNPAPQQLIIQVVDGADDVNEVGNEFQVTDNRIWLGNAGTQDRRSYTGLRFQKVLIPQGATILSAHIELYLPEQQWIEMHFNIGAEAADNSSPFTRDNKPSNRALTVTQVEHASSNRWSAGEWQSLDDIKLVIQEVVNRPGWTSGNSLSLIFQGFGGGSWGRKFVSSYDGDPAHAPRLVITYQAT
jgi:PKD repeat protein